MTAKRENGARSFFKELRLILKRARQVWHLVPRKHKWALGGAAVVMTVTAACNTAVALFMGALVDGVKQASQQGLSPAATYRMAASFLALTASASGWPTALNHA